MVRTRANSLHHLIFCYVGIGADLPSPTKAQGATRGKGWPREEELEECVVTKELWTTAEEGERPAPTGEVMP